MPDRASARPQARDRSQTCTNGQVTPRARRAGDASSHSGQELAFMERIVVRMLAIRETGRFDTPDAFRIWLEEYQDSSPGLWLIIAKKASRIRLVTYDEALEVALQH